MIERHTERRPLIVKHWTGGRRPQSARRRNNHESPRRAVLERVAGIQPRFPGISPPTLGRRGGNHQPHDGLRDLSRQVHVGCRDESGGSSGSARAG